MTTPTGTAAAARQSASGYALRVSPRGKRLTPLDGTRPSAGAAALLVACGGSDPYDITQDPGIVRASPEEATPQGISALIDMDSIENYSGRIIWL